MKGWKRLSECPICGQDRCVKNDKFVWCFRLQTKKWIYSRDSKKWIPESRYNPSEIRNVLNCIEVKNKTWNCEEIYSLHKRFLNLDLKDRGEVVSVYSYLRPKSLSCFQVNISIAGEESPLCFYFEFFLGNAIKIPTIMGDKNISVRSWVQSQIVSHFSKDELIYIFETV